MTRSNDLLHLVRGTLVARRVCQRTHRKVTVEIVDCGGGTLRTGRLLNFVDRPEKQRRFRNLHLAIAQRMELDLRSFGDSFGELRVII